MVYLSDYVTQHLATSLNGGDNTDAGGSWLFTTDQCILQDSPINNEMYSAKEALAPFI